MSYNGRRQKEIFQASKNELTYLQTIDTANDISMLKTCQTNFEHVSFEEILKLKPVLTILTATNLMVMFIRIILFEIYFS